MLIQSLVDIDINRVEMWPFLDVFSTIIINY